MSATTSNAPRFRTAPPERPARLIGAVPGPALVFRAGVGRLAGARRSARGPASGLEPRWIPPRPIRPEREPGWREAMRVGALALLAAWAIAEVALLIG